MSQTKWKLGDACFIVDAESERVQVMPAKIFRISGLPTTCAWACSYVERAFSAPRRHEGEPFPAEKEARKHARALLTKRTSWAAAHLTKIPLAGREPRLPTLVALPDIGQVVYVLDAAAAEVLEVVVGFLGIEFGQVEAGYDESPGNPETSMIRIKEWWQTLEGAQAAARSRYTAPFGLVPKEEVARRANARVDTIWAEAAARLKDPEWNRQHNESVRLFLDELRGRAPIAAG